MKRPIVLIGGGGHASVLLDIIQELGLLIKGYVSLKEEKDIAASYLGDDSILNNKELISSIMLVNAIGSVHIPHKRKDIFLKYKNIGYDFFTLIHPSVIISKNSMIGEGVQIMAGCVIQTGCIVNANALINTGACIDHHSIIGEHTHVAPGATLCGNVIVGSTSHIGPNSTVIQGCRLPEKTFIPAHRLVKD